MKVEVNVPRRWAYAVLIMLLFGSGVFAVWAYKSDYTAAGTESVEPVADVAKLGHSPNEIEVNLGTGTGTCEGKRTLQYAIANKCLGGGGSGGNIAYQIVTRPNEYEAVCPTNWQVVSGGCWCVDSSSGQDSSAYGGRPKGNGWECIATTGAGCSGGITTYAVCQQGASSGAVLVSGGFTNMQVYTSDGNWPPSGVTVPSGTKVMVEVWSGGGGGSKLVRQSALYCVTGGGGGYGKGIYTIGTGTYQVQVGNGGILDTRTGTGGDGGTSSFTGSGVSISATGGLLGGGGGTSNAPFSISGEDGTAGIIASSVISGGSGGNGGSGALSSGHSDIKSPIVPGGGGACEGGAKGRVVVWW